MLPKWHTPPTRKSMNYENTDSYYGSSGINCVAGFGR